MSNSSLYDSDFYGWAYQQAALLRNGDLTHADIANIVEELESMGRGERRELTNRLAVLLAHLLKWQVQPGLRGNSWRLTIAEQRRQVGYVVDENPSLKPQLGEILKRAYGDALLIARRETGLAENQFPTELPWTFEQAMNDAVEW
jgi:hypothetical protein